MHLNPRSMCRDLPGSNAVVGRANPWRLTVNHNPDTRAAFLAGMVDGP